MKTIGIVGLGAFGQLMAKHLGSYTPITAYDPSPAVAEFADKNGVKMTTLAEVANADLVIIATPIEKIRESAKSIRPHLKAGSVVMDVASVKMLPAAILREELPDDVEIVCTHPLFGPQSAKNGIAGLKIAVCPIRGDSFHKIVAFLKSPLGLEVIVATPEEHDREIAAAMGLTHMIAKVLVELEPLPKRFTTKSFELMMEAVEMVRYDSAELFMAIERDNPFSEELRQRFFSKADELRKLLESRAE